MEFHSGHSFVHMKSSEIKSNQLKVISYNRGTSTKFSDCVCNDRNHKNVTKVNTLLDVFFDELGFVSSFLCPMIY